MFLLDVVAILVMTFRLYFPRHRRRDMMVAFLAVNLGLLAVTSALSSSDMSLGLGFGLFAVLSIIRLRSSGSTSRRSPTTSPPSRSACSAASCSTRRGSGRC